MRHAGTQDIETPRLLLRRLLPEDAPQMYANWASDPEVTRYLRWEPHKSPAETRELLAAWALLYPNPDYYQWAMVEKATGQVFGSISLYNSLPGEPQQKTEWPGLDLTDGVWSRATASAGSGGTKASQPRLSAPSWRTGSPARTAVGWPAAMPPPTPPAAG